MAKKLPPHEADPQWAGYTLEELQYQRAYTAARLEIHKQRLMLNYHNMTRNMNPLKGRGGLVGKIFSSMSLLDYGLMAFKIGRSVYGLVKRRRK